MYEYVSMSRCMSNSSSSSMMMMEHDEHDDEICTFVQQYPHEHTTLYNTNLVQHQPCTTPTLYRMNRQSGVPPVLQ